MKTLSIIFILILSLIVSDSYPQLPNQNTYLLKNLDVAGRFYSACWGYTAPDGREYALLGCDEGTLFIDITDSANITEVDFIAGLSSSWREMKTYSHYAYIVSEALNSKLQIVDLQNLPDSVSLITTWEYDGYTRTHSISQSGPYLYLNGGTAAGGGLAAIDITNPVSPVRRGQWFTRYVHDCRVVNDTIYAANINSGKITVINAVDKDNLIEITNWDNLPNPSPHNCALTDDRKFILVTDENSFPGKLKIWNIEDLSNVTFITSWQPTNITTSIVHNVEIFENYAIIAHYTAGIRIVDISNPELPVEAAWYDTRPSDNSTGYSGCWGVYKFPSGKIIGSDISNGLFVIKTTFTLTSVHSNNIQPSQFLLNQNYPNPFNPATKISYSLTNPVHATLKIYDARGTEVTTLFDDDQNAGTYEIEFDGSDYPSGIYFYTLEANGISDTKKMIMLK